MSAPAPGHPGSPPPVWPPAPPAQSDLQPRARSLAKPPDGLGAPTVCQAHAENGGKEVRPVYLYPGESSDPADRHAQQTEGGQGSGASREGTTCSVHWAEGAYTERRG